MCRLQFKRFTIGFVQNPPFSCANARFYHAGGVACHNRARFHIPGDDGTRGDNGAVTDADSRQNNRMSADEAVFSDVRIGVQHARQIMGQNHGTKSNKGSFGNMDAARVCAIQIGFERNLRVRMNIHPQSSKMSRTKFQELAAHGQSQSLEKALVVGHATRNSWLISAHFCRFQSGWRAHIGFKRRGGGEPPMI